MTEHDSTGVDARPAIEAIYQVITEWAGPHPTGTGMTDDEALRRIQAVAAAPYSGLIATVQNAVAQGLTVHMATRATCAEHLEHGDDKATEPLTAAAFGLNVERLARAILRESGQGKPGTVGTEAAKELVEWSRRKAERLMAEYARQKPG